MNLKVLTTLKEFEDIEDLGYVVEIVDKVLGDH
jgi:hypothetical protein